ncbi:MAG TPA: hypothetical protein VL551_28140 [Actinospica sp.]|jgi:hypothetical protein|nr:hypothetical protein [Actinospica sp.]
MGNLCAHCGTAPQQISKSVLSVADPWEREQLLAKDMPAPTVEKGEQPEPTAEELEAAWDRILGDRQYSRAGFDDDAPRPRLWDYVQKAGAAEPHPLDVEAAWDEFCAVAPPSIAEQQANLAAFVAQLAQAIKERPAAKAASTPDPQWQNLSRAEKNALLPPRRSTGV